MVKAQYPAAITDFQIKFWRYTLGDLIRIGLPTFFGLALAGIPGMIIGGILGLGAAELRIHDKTVDQVVVDFIRFQLEKSQLETEIDEVGKTVITTDGTIVGIVEVDSVDLDMASRQDWQVNRDILASLYKEIEGPVEIHSRKRQVDLSNYQCIQDSAVTTDHYIVVRAYPGDGEQEECVAGVVDRCQGIRNSLNAGDLSATHLTGNQLEKVVERLQLSNISLENTGYQVNENQYRRLLSVSKYPEERGPGLLSDVLNLDPDGFIDVVQIIKPVTDKERKKLSRLIGRMKAESLATPNALRNSKINRKLADAEDLVHVEESGGERLVNAAAYIITRGNNREQVDNTTERVKRLLRRFSVEYVEPWLETPQGAKTDSLLHLDRLNQSLMMPSRSAASSFSFSTHDTFESNGISFGIDTRNGMPVILDRYSWEAGDVVRMGKKGSGKSYSAKLTLLRALNRYDDLQVYILDPKQEYGVIGDATGGGRITLDSTDLDKVKISSDVVRYTVEDRSKDNTELLIDAMQHIYQQVSQDSSKKIILVDETWHLLNDPKGVEVLGKLVREGRDINACLELITQNTTDYLRSQEGEDILKNVNCHMFFKHNEVANNVSQVFNLSQQEALELKKLGTGNDLPYSEAIIHGPVNTKLQIKATEQEHSTITQTDKTVQR